MDIHAPAEQSEGTRSQVLRWLKNIGEAVTENEPLIEIETDKVTVEIASPGTGVLREILKAEQEEISPGDVLGRLEANSAAASSGRPVASSDNTVAPSSTVRSSPTASSPGVPTVAASEGERSPSAATRLSPAVRRLLSENSLDPNAVHGTGQGGRITVEDVLAAIAARAGSGAPTPLAPAASVQTAAAPAVDVTGASRRVPHTAVRKRIAEHMVQSLLHTAPHVTTVFEADMTAVLAHREKHREEFAKRGVPLTLTAYFLQASVDAIRAVPEANSRWTDAALELFESIHIGVGTALEEGGLVVPVLRDVQSRDLFDTAAGLNDLVVRAREGKLTPADVRGGTFTISNHGVSGSLIATPIIINQPQAAILGIGKLEKRPVVVTDGGVDRIEIRPRCYVTLTLDHRVMDGHQANHFLRTFVARLTNWPA